MKQNMKNAIGLSLKRYNETYMKTTNDRIDNIVAQSGTDNTEIVDARIDSAGVTHTTLNNRILAETKMNDEQLVTYTGNYISAEDTTQGYLKNIEILGNTIQDEEDLADIRSVGEKVEGQELYEIPVLSVGKNLFDGELELGGLDTEGENISSLNRHRTKNPIRVIGNKNYIITSTDSSLALDIIFYDSSMAYISKTTNKNFITPIGCQYIKFNSRKLLENVYIQLEEGTVATEYEPYVEDKLTILSPVQLEKVGDVRDRIICKGGVWGVEKNVVKFKFTDAINYSLRGTNSSGLYGYGGVYKFGTSRNSISNKLPFNYNWNSSTPCFYLQDTDFVALLNENLTIDEFKLQYSDMIIKYPTTQPQFIPLPHDQQVKLRTFANKTNISFGCEIEGTIKAQVPKSLGATVNTHTEQISNLNKELDRVKKLEESTVSTVETESDFTTVEATSNGYFEDVKLEGKTLVNRTDIFNKVNPTGGGVHQKTSNSLIVDYSKCGELDKSYSLDETNVFKSGQIYTIIIDIIQNTLNQKVEFYPMIWDFATVISGTQFVNTGEIGRKIFVIKANKDYALKLAYASPGQATQGVTGLVEFKDIMVLEGDHTQNPPSYFEGLKSVGQGTDEIVVSSCGKNLFDGVLEIGNINNGIEEVSTTQFKSNYVKVKSNTSYITNSNIELKYIYTYFYDKNKNYIGVSTTNSFTTPSNCMYIRVKSSKVDASAITKEFLNTVKIGLVMSKVAIPYTPHQADKKRLLYYNKETQTWEKPILREWDSIEKHSDGKYYYHQRSGEVVLNGSENYTVGTEKINTYFINITSISPSPKLPSIVICDKFINGEAYGNDNDVECIDIHLNGNLHFNINKNKLSEVSINGVKQWLQANNVTVVYQLAEEKVYECTNIDLITYVNETNYVVESGAIVPRSILKVHNNISNVVSLLQKKVSLLESNITKYMITQNRMQLASTYSADSVTFKVDYALCSEEVEYNEDLYNLILNNILVGKDNYDYDKMFTMILDYASWNQISWEQFDILVGLMDIQHNPPVEELPTEDIIEEDVIENETPVE